MKKMVILFLSTFISILAVADTATGDESIESTIDYYSCLVNEGTTKVSVKFAVKNLSLPKQRGELIQYPNSVEEQGLISVVPSELPDGKWTLMSNLNGQGGDLRIEGTNLRLFGDGAGWQFTDLVIWDLDSENTELEGYVRDYGPTYGDVVGDTFKQFIKCQRSQQVL